MVCALEAKIPAPVVTLAVAAAMRLLVPAAPPDPLRATATAAVAQASAVIAVAAFFAFWRARTTIDPWRPERASVLVTRGIYRFSRNPIYLSLLLLLVAYAIELGAPLGVLGPLAFVAYVTRYQVMPEERALERKFGDDWVQYCRRVRRWI